MTKHKKIVNCINGSEYYIKEFATWEDSEQIIDDNKAFWMEKLNYESKQILRIFEEKKCEEERQ